MTKTIRPGAAAPVLKMTAAALVLVMTTVVGAQDKPAPAAQEKPAPAAQEKPAASPSPSRPPQSQVLVKIQLVLSRYQGEKKLSSAPYLLWVTSNDQRTSLRMGVRIPVYSGGSYSYQDVGTNIDCGVGTGPDGTYRVILTVEDRSIYFPDRDRPNAGIPPPISDTAPPAFRSFTSTFAIQLRDGQTGQYTSVTDQTTGEVLKIDATLNVLK